MEEVADIEECERCGSKMLHVTRKCGCEKYVCYNCGYEVIVAKCKQHERLAEDRRYSL